MTSPVTTKTARFSPDTHARLMALAERLDGTADDALAHLLGLSTVCVPVSDLQRQRWIIAAERCGVTLEQFVVMRVEAAVQYNGDPGGLQQIYEHVSGIARALQLRAAGRLPGDPPSTP